MTMTVEQAIAKVDDFFACDECHQTLSFEDVLQAWRELRSHIEGRVVTHTLVGYIDTGELSRISLDDHDIVTHLTVASSPNQYEDTPIYIQAALGVGK